MKIKTIAATAALTTTLLTGCAAMHVQPHTVAQRIDPISITNQQQFNEDVQTCTRLANDPPITHLLKRC